MTEALEGRRLFDMVYPGNGGDTPPAEEPASFVLGSKWSTTNLTYSFSNLLDGNLPGGLSASVLESAMEEALQVWSAYSPLRFTEVSDIGPVPSDTNYTAGSSANLRIGHHYIDGGDGANVLAHAYFPSTSGLGGDLHFDDGNTWSTTPSSSVDIIEVGVHELGHAIGLNHVDSSVANAIMNPYYGGRYSGPGSAFLLQDDINGIQAQYGTGLGYVISDGTLFLSGTSGADALSVDINGSTFTLANGTRTVSGSIGGISNIVVNARGGNDTIHIGRTGPVAVSVNGGAGTDALTLSDKAGTFAGEYTINPGVVARTDLADFTYSATESLALEGSDAGATFTVNSGSVTLRTNGGDDAVNVNTDNAGTASVLFDHTDESLAALTIGAGGTATLLAGTNAMERVLTVETLSLASTAKLDLTNGGLIVDYTSASPITDLGESLSSARADGDWGGHGITSSLVGSAGLYAVGYGESAEALGVSGSATADWRGRQVDSTAVLVRFTYAGDANLDGIISGDDYSAIDFNINLPSATGYAAGDFNFDGIVSGDDYTVIDFNIMAQGAAL